MKNAHRWFGVVLTLGFVASCASAGKRGRRGPSDPSAPRVASDTEDHAGVESESYESRPAGDAPLPPSPVEKQPTQEPNENIFGETRVINGIPYADMFFKHYGTNPTIETAEENTSTFSIDVDTASYSMMRSYLNRGHLPNEAAVRVEEFINNFDYGYEAPSDFPFSVQAEAFPSPNREGYYVLHLGVQGKRVSKNERKPANLIFVIDVSGSMARGNRLGMVKKALTMLVEQLDERDSVGIVVYGSTAHKVLELTSATQKAAILDGIQRLRSEGSTNVQAGLQIAYDMASKNFLPQGINRLILCSDGVANNGVTDAGGIFDTISERAKRGITMSAVGFGMGNYNDVLMERLADSGDGNYAYVDRIEEAKRVFVENLTGTLQVIAKDVKLQIEFDPRVVARYRLIGYENRVLDNKDFANDKVDAGEIGAGHNVTAMYEVKFRGLAPQLGTLRIRYKDPEGGASKLIERPLPRRIVRTAFSAATPPARLSYIAAGFGEKLRGSYWARNVSYQELVRFWEGLPEELTSQAQVDELRELILVAEELDTRGDKFRDEVPVAHMDFDHVPVLR